MNTVTISMSNLNDIYEFVRRAMLVEGDITLSRGKYAVDAKSLLGVFSIDLSKDTLLTYPTDAEDFEDFITPFVKDFNKA